MALEIEPLVQPAEGAVYRSPVRLAVTAEDELCEDTDARAVRLLVAAGGEIPVEVARRYGLIAETAGKVPAGKARKGLEDKGAGVAAAGGRRAGAVRTSPAPARAPGGGEATPAEE